MDVVVDDSDDAGASYRFGEAGADERESSFYTCHVCGDNWLSFREEDEDGECLVTFIHQMGMDPVLKRVAHMETPIVLREDTVDHWEYFLDEESVDRSVWFRKLKRRRRLLKSICTN